MTKDDIALLRRLYKDKPGAMREIDIMVIECEEEEKELRAASRQAKKVAPQKRH